MKILLLGKDGQIGFELQKNLKYIGNLISTNRKMLDLEDSKALCDFLNTIKPDFLINAAGFTDVDLAEINFRAAVKVNVTATKIITKYAVKNDIPLIQYSSSYIFDGLKKTSYLEDDKPNPISVYGKTKLKGEEEVRKHKKHIILRTNWVFSNRKNNILVKLLKMIKENKPLFLLTDQYGSPTSANLIAKITCDIVSKIKINNNFNEFGTYNIESNGKITPLIFANEIIKFFNFSHQDIKKISRTQYYSFAFRPQNSKLNTNKIQRIFGVNLPDWKVQLREVIFAKEGFYEN